MSKEVEAIKLNGIRRIFNKVLNVFAKWTLMPGSVRARIHKMRGVHFDDVYSVFIGENVIIDGIYPQNVSIGKRCIITAEAKILTHFLDTDRLSDDPNFYFRFYQGRVRIEEDVFIGFNAVISKPVIIGKGSIIGANAVITKDVDPYSVMVGIPAKCVKKIDPPKNL